MDPWFQERSVDLRQMAGNDQIYEADEGQLRKRSDEEETRHCQEQGRRLVYLGQGEFVATIQSRQGKILCRILLGRQDSCKTKLEYNWSPGKQW